ncbi:hypothetical protein [Dactylosporangium sp. NPDC051484]|uniref:hypothetical protein n=1 Tax=Dactylosporangium sp. NPDC051484 TaxID=3154942 RepID=UPI00344CD210
MTTSRGPANMMFLVAAVEFLVGAGLLIAGLAVGAALMLGSLLLFWLGMKFNYRAARARALRERGVPGTAQVLGARQTGMTLNDQPQVALDLRVTAPGHGTYDASIKDFVPFIALGMLGSGRPLTVRVDPHDRQRILIDWEFTPPAGAAEVQRAVAGPDPVDPAEAALVMAHILATGVPGTVRVLSAEFAGSLDEQGRPVYSAQLHIQVEGRNPVAGPAVFAVPLERVSVMRPGGMIPIKADPYDPRKFAADWDRLTTS